MKVANARIRVKSNWRDIEEINCTREKINLLATNKDSFSFNNSSELSDEILLISVKDFFKIINNVDKSIVEDKQEPIKESPESEEITKIEELNDDTPIIPMVGTRKSRKKTY